MRVMLLSRLDSIHSIKWANSLSKRNIEILICGFQKSSDRNFLKENYSEAVKVIDLSHSGLVSDTEGSFTKVIYLRVIPLIRRYIKEFKPDILHAHYASSYGLLGALAGFHPYVLSLWGGDIVSFPETSFLHKYIFKYNISKADVILSTSKFMADMMSKYSRKPAIITPFGVDTDKFKPGPRNKNIIKGEFDCVIGTIKSLEWYYGIEYLIRSFRILLDKLPQKKLHLMITGGGSQEAVYREEIKKQGVEDHVLMTGKILPELIPEYHNSLDIFAALSVYPETFGVSVVEASACGKPVVVTNVGGLPEVVDDNITGFLVPPRNILAAAEKMEQLISDPELAQKMGTAGRQKVILNFQWAESVDVMVKIYKKIIDNPAGFNYF